MKVLVTGAAGFIGAALARRLCERGDEVLGIDNLNDYYDVSLKEGRLKHLQEQGFGSRFQFERFDLVDATRLEQVYKTFRPDRIAHMAAQPGVRYSLQNPQAYIDSNIRAFMNLLEIARHQGTEHFVYASSSSVYGANTHMPYSTADRVDHPLSLYAATKKSNEVMAHCYSHLYQIPMTGLRFFTVYGPWGRPDMAVFSFTKKILAGESIDVFNHGHHRRDFTFVDDIVEGVVRVIDKPATGNPEWNGDLPETASSQAPYRLYNIGNHQPVLLSDFIETLEQVIGRKAEKVYKDMQPGDVPDTYADVDDLRNTFNWSPNTSLKDGLTRFYDWYKAFYN